LSRNRFQEPHSHGFALDEDPGSLQYPWGGGNLLYPCTTGGTSQSKLGTNYPWVACESTQDPNDTCNLIDVMCQRDTYYKLSGCWSWCNEYTRYTSGCKKDAPNP
jgi:hypothetical protein